MSASCSAASCASLCTTSPTELFGVVWASPATYSLIYNGSYMLIDTVICLVIFGVLYRPLDKYLQARDIRA